MADTRLTCRHCDTPLSKWRPPDGAGWDEDFFFVCFNDECSYYRSGWTWMMQEYSRKASYRYMLNPKTGCESPLPVWSETAMRELIIENGNGDES